MTMCSAPEWLLILEGLFAGSFFTLLLLHVVFRRKPPTHFTLRAMETGDPEKFGIVFEDGKGKPVEIKGMALSEESVLMLHADLDQWLTYREIAETEKADDV